MKDLSYTVNNEVVNKMLEISSKEGGDFALIGSSEGALNDNYIFINYESEHGKGVTLGRKHKPRKWIIIKEVYLNEWSSDLVAIETDNEKEVDKFIKNYEVEEV